MPANITLAESELLLASKYGREQYLKKALEPLAKKYDYCIIDSSPSLSVLTINVLSAVDEIIVPVKPEFLSLEGVSSLIKTITELQAVCNSKIKIAGFLVTLADYRRTSTKETIEFLQQMADGYKTKVFTSQIRYATAVADAPSYSQTILEYSPKSPVALDYMEFGKEYLASTKRS